jgi:hypothetical protein
MCCPCPDFRRTIRGRLHLPCVLPFPFLNHPLEIALVGLFWKLSYVFELHRHHLDLLLREVLI